MPDEEERTTPEENIFNRLSDALTFHPASVSLFTPDWTLEPGDVVKVLSGEEEYDVPIFTMDLSWNGAVKTDVQSTGNQERQPLSALKRIEYQTARRGYGATRKLEEDVEETVQQYQHFTEENEVYRRSVYKIMGVTYDEHGNVIYQRDPVTGELILDEAGNPIPVYDETSNGSITGQVLQTAQNYTSLYQMTLNAPEFDKTATYQIGDMVMHGGVVYKFTAEHTGDWTGLDVAVVPPLQSQITQNAQEISQKVSSGDLAGYMTISAMQTAFGNTAVASNGTITKAEFSTSVVGGVAKAGITADKIALDATNKITLGDKIEISSGMMYARMPMGIGTTNPGDDIVTINSGKVTANEFDVKINGHLKFVTGNQTYYDITSSVAGNFVTGFGTPTETGGQISIPFYTIAKPSTSQDVGTINFNIADTAFYQSGIGISSATINTTTDNPDVWTDWTNGTHEYPYGTLTQKYALIQVTPNDGDPYYFCIDASSGTGGSASIDDISGTALTPDQILYQTIPIKASGTNVSDYTENATLTNTTYTDNSTTYPCVTLTMDSIVIGRISTQATYDNGKLVGQNTTRVSKGTWSNGSIVFTTNAPNPAANVPVTLTLTHAIGNTWTWTSVDDSGEYQLTAQIKDGTTVVATDSITLPDTKVVVTSPGTQQSSWWKTSGTNAYKYVIPASSASGYLTADTNNEHLLATGNGTQTVIDPTEAVDRGFGICHDSIGLSETTQTIPSGQSITIYPTAKASATASSATNITSAGITLTAEAATVVDPKVSKGTWQNGSITFTAGTAGDDTSTLKLYTSGAYSGTLDNVQNPTKVSFSILEDTGSGTTAATGATIFANISTTTGTLKLGNFNETNNTITVSLDTKPSVNIGGSSAIQSGVTQKDIVIARGTAQPNTPQWNESAHTYTITAGGSFTVGNQQITQTQGFIDGGFVPSDAIAYGRSIARGIAAITSAPTNATAYGQAGYEEIPVESNGYYILTVTPVEGSPAYRKFHAPASGGPMRYATGLTDTIVLTEQDTGNAVTKTGLRATYTDGNSDAEGQGQVSVTINALAVYEAGQANAAAVIYNGEITYARNDTQYAASELFVDVSAFPALLLTDTAEPPNTTTTVGSKVTDTIEIPVTVTAATLTSTYANGTYTVTKSSGGKVSVDGADIDVGVTSYPISAATAIADGRNSVEVGTASLNDPTYVTDTTQAHDRKYTISGTVQLDYQSGVDGSGNPVYTNIGNPVTIQAKNITSVYNDGYASGWGAAFGNVTLPASEQTTNAYMDVLTPPQTVDGNAVSKRYTVSVDGSYAYIKTGNPAVTVARVANTGATVLYGEITGIVLRSAGGVNYAYSDDDKEYTVYLRATGTNVSNSPYDGQVVISGSEAYSHGWGRAHNQVSIPTAQQTTNAYIDIGYPTDTVDGTAGSQRYTVSVDNDYAYIKAGNTTVARTANTGSSTVYGTITGVSLRNVNGNYRVYYEDDKEYDVYLQATGTNQTNSPYNALVTVSAVEAYNHGAGSVAPTGITLSTYTVNSSSNVRASLVVPYTGNSTGIPFNDVDVTEVYQAGYNAGETTESYPVYFDVTMGDGKDYTRTVSHVGPVELKDVYNAGANDAAPTEPQYYIYAPYGNVISVDYSTASNEYDCFFLYPKTKVTYGGVSGNYTKITYGGCTGYVRSTLVENVVTPTSPTDFPGKTGFATPVDVDFDYIGRTNTDRVNLRKEDSTSSSRIYVMPINSVVYGYYNPDYIEPNGFQWAYCKKSENRYILGYVQKQYITEGAEPQPDDPTTKYIYASNGGAVNARETASDSGTVYGQLKPRTPVTVLSGPTNGYYQVQYLAKTGSGTVTFYVASAYLSDSNNSPTNYTGTGWITAAPSQDKTLQSYSIGSIVHNGSEYDIGSKTIYYLVLNCKSKCSDGTTVRNRMSNPASPFPATTADINASEYVTGISYPMSTNNVTRSSITMRVYINRTFTDNTTDQIIIGVTAQGSN